MSAERQLVAPPEKRGRGNIAERLMNSLAESERQAEELENELSGPMAATPHSLRWFDDFTPSFDVAAVAKRVEEVRAHVHGPTDPRAARLGFAAMLDGIPSATKFDSAGYLDALVTTILAEPATEPFLHKDLPKIDRGGFPSAIIAAAVRELWRTKTFVPSIAEVLSELKSERKRLQQSVVLGQILLARVEKFERNTEENRALREEYRGLLAKARAANDQRFMDDCLEWQIPDELQRLRRYYGKAPA